MWWSGLAFRTVQSRTDDRATLLIKGTVESRDGVTHVIASALYDHSHALSVGR